MKSKLLSAPDGERSWAIILDTGDEAMASLLAFAREQSLAAARFTAIGAFSHAVLGYFDWQTKKYDRIPVEEQVEVVSLIGDVAIEKSNRNPKIHAHCVVTKPGGVALGGHLLEGYVRPTLEIMLTESPKHLQREFDPASGLALIRV